MPPDPAEPDPFSTLGLPPEFDLDPGTLSRAYLALSARLHPDIARGDPDAARRSAAANRAKAVLEDPESRAGALLGLLGGPAKESDKSLPPGFLAGMLETREQIESAAAAGDPAALAPWQRWASQQRQDYTGRVASLFQRHGEAPPGDRPALLKQIRLELNAWRYIERLIEQLDPAYDPARADFRDSSPS